MMPTDNHARSPLLPERHPTLDFFVCDVFDAAPKGDMASMEHPIFSLSTKPDHRVRRYEHNDNFIEVKPSSDGLATVHDRDVLIYCISQLVAALNRHEHVSQVVRFRAHDLLKATNRMTNGQGYEALKAAFERLSGTRISTNIVTGGREEFETFGLIERARIVRETRDGRMQEIEIKLSDWVFGAIQSQEVLTLHRDYFRLRRPIERRLYELARKHCGRQPEWRISLELLRKKCGSGSTLKEFKRLVGKVVQDDARNHHMPDYRVRLEERRTNAEDIVVFESRGTIPTKSTSECRLPPPLAPDTYHTARVVAPGWDVHELERQWRSWAEASGAEPPRDVNAAFIGFCRKWTGRHSLSPRRR
ncbi:replication initiator protein A [Lignipirellula cremea]|uniref:Replication initiator protein A n=1 Tax=Lignipirellula cremea TaxID=2528010 RepID=A0A518E3E3_9BACT|nr:replication initiator protein A [Lignipirellula cremea]QDU98615.1 Replication initiator protein A [Lignipirellula cremea]